MPRRIQTDGQLPMRGRFFHESPDGTWAAGLSQPSAKP